MTRKRRKPSPDRPQWHWSPMRRVPDSARQVSDLALAAAATDPKLAAMIAAQERNEMWQNDRYTAIVSRHEEGWVMCISVRRNDRGYPRDWRHLQRIKNDIAGDEIEALELYPAESRKVDTANQTYLWCMPPEVRLPLGFDERLVEGPGEAAAVGAVQRPHEPDEVLRTKTGKILDDDEIERLSEEAERGYDISGLAARTEEQT